MLPVEVLVGVAVAGMAFVAAGVALIRRVGTKWPGTAFSVAGALVLLSAYLYGADLALAEAAATASMLAVSLAVLLYPRPAHDVGSLAGIVAAPIATVALLGQAVRAGGFHLAEEVNGLAVLLTLITLGQVWWRLESGGPSLRRPLTLVLACTAIVVLAIELIGFLRTPLWLDGLSIASLGLIGGAAWLGVARPRVVDARGVGSVVAVNAVAGVGLFAFYQTIVLSLGAVAGRELQAAEVGLVVLVCAALFEPVRRVLRLVADELLFGVRPDPLAAAGQIALGVGDEPRAALEALRTALVLPYAALRVAGLPTAAVGEPAEIEHTVPLRLDGAEVGQLVVGLRAGDLRLPGAEAQVLALAAPLLAQTVRLQAAREMAAAAREEERLRLRRDLHDGLGPRLSGIAFTADAARLSVGDTERLTRHLDRVRTEAVSAIREIRELVYGLRPPALDEVGLAEAIALQTAGLPIRVSMVVGDLPSLPPAVEVAAYRIAVEALTNSARHSGSREARAGLSVEEGRLIVEISDRGAPSGSWAAGVGLSSMRERAHELGGTLTISESTVRAALPL